MEAVGSWMLELAHPWGLVTGGRVVGILQLILREKLIVTSRSWLWFASVG